MKKALLTILVLSTFFGCEKNGLEESTSRFMLIHASPNTPDIEFRIDDKPLLLQPLVYTSNTYYRDILSGVRNFKVVVSGNTQIDTNLNFEKDAVRSFLFYDKPLDFKMLIIDDVLAGSNAGKCRVRFFQGVPDATNVDLINTYTNTVVAANINLGENGGWTTIPAGLINWELRNSNDQSVIYSDWRPDTLEAGKNYTIISNGFKNTLTNDTIGVWPICHENFIQ